MYYLYIYIRYERFRFIYILRYFWIDLSIKISLDLITMCLYILYYLIQKHYYLLKLYLTCWIFFQRHKPF